MKYLAVTLMLILVYSIAEIEAASDTTYSTIRVKKKKKSSSSSSSSSQKSYDDDEDDKANCFDVGLSCIELFTVFAEVGNDIAESRAEREREKAMKSFKSDTSNSLPIYVPHTQSKPMPTFQVDSLQQKQYNSLSIDSALETHRGRKSTKPQRRRLTPSEQEQLSLQSSPSKLSATTQPTSKMKKSGGNTPNAARNTSYFTRPLHLKMGFSGGVGVFEDNNAHGGHAGLPVSLNWHPTEAFGMRLIAEPSVEGSVMEVDFARTVFVDGTPVGVQEFLTDSYRSLITPFRLDLLLFPKTETNSFHFIFGAGMAYTKETTKGILISPGANYTYTARSHDWNPTVHVGFGWQINKATVEVGYSYIGTEDSGLQFTPSDNSDFRGKITTSVSIALF